MAARERKKVDEPSAPLWVVTYGDMMSLLLTFFILLLSFSTVSGKDFEKAMASLQGAFGVMPKYDSILSVMPTSMKRRTPKEVERMARELQRELQVAGQDQDVKVEFDKEGGLRIVLRDRILFDTAKADLKPEAFEVLDRVALLLGEMTGAVFEVRGHTDARPLLSTLRFRDNYDLSYARADAVARRLNAAGKLPMERFEIVACGPGQPVASNQTEEGMQANRRVEIYVRTETKGSTMSKLERVGAGAAATAGLAPPAGT